MMCSRLRSITAVAFLASVHAFVPGVSRAFLPPRPSTRTTNTQLNAIGVLARKAKEAEVRQYCQEGVEDAVLEKYKAMKEALPSVEKLDNNNSVGPLQEALTKRRGTITIVAEYKRKMEGASGYIDEVFDPEVLSPVFREYGATAIAVLADDRMGGCTYDDLAKFVEEQGRACNEVPGPLMVISNDFIVDEIQIARSAAYGAKGVVLQMGALGKDKVTELLKVAKALDMEAIVAVSSKEEAQTAIDIGGRIISVVGVNGVDDKVAVIDNLDIPEGAQVCTIANILTRDNKEFEEIEEAWACRSKGFNSVWVSEALYKGGSNEAEHPGAVINSMKAKSSTKWASPKARSGKGEGAREYLGDIMM